MNSSKWQAFYLEWDYACASSNFSLSFTNKKVNLSFFPANGDGKRRFPLTVKKRGKKRKKRKKLKKSWKILLYLQESNGICLKNILFTTSRIIFTTSLFVFSFSENRNCHIRFHDENTKENNTLFFGELFLLVKVSFSKI